MRRRRTGPMAALALAACGGDAGTDPETYLRDAMHGQVTDGACDMDRVR
ncbi:MULTISPECIES: hypothetical protein [Micromonospora]|nr:hypothetical protein [Micromonospora sp. Mcm103]